MVSQELGRLALENGGLLNVELPDVILNTQKYMQRADLRMSPKQIQLPEPATPILVKNIPGELWWSWLTNPPPNPPLWWAEPRTKDVSANIYTLY